MLVGRGSPRIPFHPSRRSGNVGGQKDAGARMGPGFRQEANLDLLERCDREPKRAWCASRIGTLVLDLAPKLEKDA